MLPATWPADPAGLTAVWGVQAGPRAACEPTPACRSPGRPAATGTSLGGSDSVPWTWGEPLGALCLAFSNCETGSKVEPTYGCRWN